MKLEYFSVSDTGNVRKTNEDFHLEDESLGLFVVCDGVGGQAGGKVAAELCAKVVLEQIQKNQSVIRTYKSDPTLKNRSLVAAVVEQAIQSASAKIFETCDTEPSLRGMSTTCEVLLFAGDHAILGHVGDSRCYVYREEKLHQLTEDHKVSNEMLKKGLWKKDEAAKSPYSNVLTRAVGLQKFVEVDLLQVELMHQDLFLLCSDGLSNYFGTPELADMLGRTKETKQAQNLVRLAKDRGGNDNITSTLIRYLEEVTSNTGINILRKSDIAGKVAILRYFTYAEIMKLLSHTTAKTYSEGQTILKEGAEGNELLIITDGKANIVKGGLIIATRTKGEALGEMGIFDNAPRSASVTAAQATAVLSITRQHLIDLLRQDSLIAVKFLWAINQELNKALRTTSKDLAEARSHIETPFTQSNT